MIMTKKAMITLIIGLFIIGMVTIVSGRVMDPGFPKMKPEIAIPCSTLGFDKTVESHKFDYYQGVAVTECNQELQATAVTESQNCNTLCTVDHACETEFYQIGGVCTETVKTKDHPAKPGYCEYDLLAGQMIATSCVPPTPAWTQILGYHGDGEAQFICQCKDKEGQGGQ